MIVTLLFFTNCGGDKTTTDDYKASENTTEEKSEATTKETKTEMTEGDDLSNKGVGPISSIELGDIDQTMVAEGETIYKEKCTACHKIDKRFVGPAPTGIIERRSPEWIMNMILNPEKMVKEDPIAIALLAEYNYAAMANQNLTEEEARKILEYFRTL